MTALELIDQILTRGKANHADLFCTEKQLLFIRELVVNLTDPYMDSLKRLERVKKERTRMKQERTRVRNEHIALDNNIEELDVEISALERTLGSTK